MRPRGGIIGANITPTQTAASGIWTLREVEAYQRAGAWAALPGAPTSVSGTSGSTQQVSLTWSAPAATGGYSITDYAVQYSSDSGSSWTTFSRSASSSTSATVTGLTNGTAYVFRVAAVTVVGTGAFSTASSSITPSAPQTLILTTVSGSVVPTGAGTSASPFVFASDPRINNGINNQDLYSYFTASASGTVTIAWTAGSFDSSNWAIVFPLSIKRDTRVNPPSDRTGALFALEFAQNGSAYTRTFSVSANQQFYVWGIANATGSSRRIWIS